MRIKESDLRYSIRAQLLEEQVGTGGIRSGYTHREKQRIARSFRDEVEQQAEAAGILKPGDEWSMLVYVGWADINISRRTGDIRDVKRSIVKQIAVSAANNTQILDRSRFKSFQGLKLAIGSGGKATGAAADVKPGQDDPD